MTALYGRLQTSTHPRWAKDYFNREHVVPGGALLDATQFTREDNVVVQVNNASNISVGATTIAVDALSGAIPANTMLRFSNGSIVYVTAAAASGATSLTVEAVQVAIPDNTQAVFQGSGRIVVPDGTVVGRTLTERDAGTGFGPAAAGDAVDGTGEVYITCWTVDDAGKNPQVELYRWGGGVASNFLPGFDSLNSTVKAYLYAKYQITRGAD
jgi:hypothetical protein